MQCLKLAALAIVVIIMMGASINVNKEIRKIHSKYSTAKL